MNATISFIKTNPISYKLSRKIIFFLVFVFFLPITYPKKKKKLKLKTTFNNSFFSFFDVNRNVLFIEISFHIIVR